MEIGEIRIKTKVWSSFVVQHLLKSCVPVFIQYHGVRHPLAMTVFGPKYGLAGPPPPMYDYGYGPVQQGGLPMPSPFFGQQAPGSWQQQFGPAPVQQPEAPVQGEETVQQPATSR